MTQEDNIYDIEPRRSPLLQNNTAPTDPSVPAPAADTTTGPTAVPVSPDDSTPPPGFVPPVCVVEGPDPVPDDNESLAAQAAAQDAEAHRTVAILGYLVFLLPLLFAPNSRFARYHANQALLVFITGAALGIVQTFVTLLFQYGPTIEAIAIPLNVIWMLTVLLRIMWLVLWVVLIGMGMNHAAAYTMTPLPLIGSSTLINPDPDPQPAQEPMS